MASTIQLRIDEDLKKQSDELFKELGTDTVMMEEQMMNKLETARRHAEEGKYQSADDVISSMRDAYGL